MGIELLDNQKQETENNAPVLLTLGVFAYLMLSSVDYMAESLFRDFFIHLEWPGVLCLLLPEIVSLLVTIFLTLFLSKRIKKGLSQGTGVLKNILKNIVLIFLFVQMAEYFYAFYRYDLWPSDFINKVKEVYSFDYLSYYQILTIIVELLTWGIMGAIFMRK